MLSDSLFALEGNFVLQQHTLQGRISRGSAQRSVLSEGMINNEISVRCKESPVATRPIRIPTATPKDKRSPGWAGHA